MDHGPQGKRSNSKTELDNGFLNMTQKTKNQSKRKIQVNWTSLKLKKKKAFMLQKSPIRK